VDLVDDLRGKMIRARRRMIDDDTRSFLKSQKVAFVGTVDANGWPYVVPLTYIYLGDENVWVHTGAHQGHFLTNVEHNPRVCLTVADIGGMETAGQYLCDGSQLYSSVVVFGTITIVRNDDVIKRWFFDQLRAKYVPAEISADLSADYPDIAKIIVYRIAIDQMTGKRSTGVGH
jgi:nitroimidazol reductase NimA-like FMN-containing flavoprotein (pyridoxamine 5'-phosphate oxidase superfamily)